MKIKDATKNLLADSLINLTNSIPIQNIRISDIVNDCGASRQTFYNNFKDKDDLTFWIFTRNFQDPIREFQDYDAFCEKAASVIDKNRKFFLQAYKNSILLGWQEKWSYDNMYNFIISTYGKEATTEEVEYALESFVRGAYRVFETRLNSGKKVDITQLIIKDMNNMPAILRQFFPHRNQNTEKKT